MSWFKKEVKSNWDSPEDFINYKGTVTYIMRKEDDIVSDIMEGKVKKIDVGDDTLKLHLSYNVLENMERGDRFVMITVKGQNHLIRKIDIQRVIIDIID